MCCAVDSALAESRSATITHAPSSANATAEARPIPEPAPVITLTSPCKRPMTGSVLQGGEDFVGMPLHFDVRKHGFDRATAVDHERRSGDAHVLATHELFLLPHPVLLGDGVIGIGQEWE